jgi:hypothetical protein
MKHLNSRRSFLKTLGLAAAAVVAAPIVKIQSALADAAPKLVDANDPLAKALAYVADAKKSKDRKDKKALCSNCQFYQGDAKSKQGKCQLIPTGEVMATGWCRSYSEKKKA